MYKIIRGSEKSHLGVWLREVRCYHLATELCNVTVHYISASHIITTLLCQQTKKV